MKPAASNGWNQFFFARIDARIYAALRIAVGLILSIHVAVLARNWLMWFGESGVLDLASARANVGPHMHSVLHWVDGSPAILWGCLAVICVQVFALTLGLATRFNSICVFVWLVSLHHRNNMIWEGEDLLLRIFCFLLIFMPAARCWSVDALIRKRKLPAHGSVEKPDPAFVLSTAAVWPLRLLQLELSCLYLSSVVQKLAGEYWQNGTAIQYVLRLDDVSGHRVPLANLLVQNLGADQILTWMTVGIEIMLAFLVWIPPVRRAIVCIGIAFHLSLELTMDLFLFQWMMILILATHLFSPLAFWAKSSPIKNPSSQAALITTKKRQAKLNSRTR